MWGFVGILVLQPRFGPAWRVGDSGEAGVGGRLGLWAKGVAGDANDLVGTVKAFRGGGMMAFG